MCTCICSSGSYENLSEDILLPERVTRISTCEIEADALAADITNRRTATGIYYSNLNLLLKIMVKQATCLTPHHKGVGGMEIKLHTFCTSTVDGVDLSASCCSLFPAPFR
jgi:hypothetical protein